MEPLVSIGERRVTGESGGGNGWLGNGWLGNGRRERLEKGLRKA
jgi:hypothetical protein